MSSRDRLSVAQNFKNGQSDEEQFHSTPKSASLAKAEKTIKELQEENSHLKAELLETQSLYNQLVKDTSHEKYDERRVNMLKCQIVQLERQLLMLSESLSSRSDVLLDIENHLTYLADICRNHLECKTQIGAVSFSSVDVTKMLESAESARIKLFKNIENSRIEKQTRPVILLDTFIKTQTSEPVTMLDICGGSLQHINIKKVGKLESKLSQLYKQLLALNQCIHVILPDNQQKSTNQRLPEAVYTRLGCQVIKSCDLLKECTQDLLSLSVLLPAAPWPSLQRPVLDEITVDIVMSALPKLPRSKHSDIQQTIDALLKALNYQLLTTQSEIDVLKEELQFHKRIYDLQNNYVDSMFQALREGYTNFEADMTAVICKPIQDVLTHYETLKTSAGEEGLRELLVCLKDNADQLQSVVDKLTKKKKVPTATLR